MSLLNLVTFPGDNVSDVPRMLRQLADNVEAGKHGDALNIAWVCDCGNGRIDIGLCGKAASAGTDAHFLYALAQRKLENGCLAE